MGHIWGTSSMIQPTQDFESSVQSLKDLLEPLLTGGKGRLHLRGFEGPKEATLEITSTRGCGAPIEVTLDEDFGAYLTVGKGSIFEIPFDDKRYSQRGFMDSVVTLISAIINNGFEEAVLISKGEVVGASAIIRRGGSLTTDAKDSWRKIGRHLFSKRERERHTYPPY